jgi:hypothetical protein
VLGFVWACWQGLEERARAAGSELREKEGLVERLRGEAKSALDRAEEAERAAGGAAGQALEAMANVWEEVGAGLGRADEVCVGLERALCVAGGHCEQVRCGADFPGSQGHVGAGDVFILCGWQWRAGVLVVEEAVVAARGEHEACAGRLEGRLGELGGQFEAVCRERGMSSVATCDDLCLCFLLFNEEYFCCFMRRHRQRNIHAMFISWSRIAYLCLLNHSANRSLHAK